MANLFIDLPVPSGNGFGAAVDVSSQAGLRTFIVEGEFESSLTIEASQDGTNWSAVVNCTDPCERTVEIAACFMRVAVRNFFQGTPNVSVGSEDLGTQSASLPATASNGEGAAVDVSDLGTRKTIFVCGEFTGSVNIEGSNDGTNFASLATTTTCRNITFDKIVSFIRVRRAAVIAGNEGLPNVGLCAANDVGGGAQSAFASHWNTSDGNTGDQSVNESVARIQSRISAPNGGEGSPFFTGGGANPLWVGTEQPAIDENVNGGVATFATAGATTGWGGTATMSVRVFDADGVTVLDSFVAPVTANGVQVSGSGFITVNVAGFTADSSRFKANVSVDVDFSSILATVAAEGGRFHVECTQATDAGTDGNGPFSFVQDDVFSDFQPTTPSISGAFTIVEGASVITKHLSGLEYYILGSEWDISITDIDQLNRNTQRISTNVQIDASGYGVNAFGQAPYPGGAGNALFSGWTDDNDQDGVDYNDPARVIDRSDFRLMDLKTTANPGVVVQDPWSQSGFLTDLTLVGGILIDTFASPAADTSDLREPFDDETRREFIDGVNGAASGGSFPGAGLWPSATSLATVGGSSAMVYNGLVQDPRATLLEPSGGANTDWSTFDPTVGGANPDYTGLAGDNYGRRFLTAGGPSPNGQMFFQGTFAAGDALAALLAGDIEIYVYRIAGSGNTGAPPGNTNALRIHEPFNFALFDDGATVAGSGIRLGSSAGNTIDFTWGGLPVEQGFYFHLRILDLSTRIDDIQVVFN